MRTVHNLKKYLGLRKSLRNNMTEAEKKLWLYLKNSQLGHKFRRQASIGNYIVDFYCPAKKLVIEIDGSQHIEQEQKDIERTKYLESLNIKVIRFWNNDVLKETEEIVNKIINVISTTPQVPSSDEEGR